MYPITIKILYFYQWKDPELISTYKCARCKTGFSWRQEYYTDFNIRGLNSYSKQILDICSSLVSHLYPLSCIGQNGGNYFQQLCQPGIREVIWNGVKNYDIFQRRK